MPYNISPMSGTTLLFLYVNNSIKIQLKSHTFHKVWKFWPLFTRISVFRPLLMERVVGYQFLWAPKRMTFPPRPSRIICWKNFFFLLVPKFRIFDPLLPWINMPQSPVLSIKLLEGSQTTNVTVSVNGNTVWYETKRVKKVTQFISL